MNFIKGILPWKRTLFISIAVLVILNIFSFYGLYTNKFYFFKIDNYIFPILTIVHFIFLYVLWFKIKEDELSDPPMRNLEYSLYIILFVYAYKLFDNLFILISYGEFENHLIPGTFLPLGILIFTLHLFLIGLTLLAFSYRKEVVGNYLFDDMNQHVDSWK
ncbi:hypothetical protein [Maribacter aestuarii]|uniref:hypothetical protein n=1 Tax=Maribacter aestuarii TaxID=1130723 RepID=UPI00248CE318|nr:hypothetical protein [Maribacter aestuarii]